MNRIFQGWPVLAWSALGSAAAILILGFVIPLPRFSEGSLQGRAERGDIIPLLRGTVIQGTVRARWPGLSKVKVLTATYARRNTCRLEAQLLREGRVIARTVMRTSWFPDLDWVEVPFYDLGSNLAEGEYTIRFSSPDSDPDNAVALVGGIEKGMVLSRPVYCTERLPAWTWLIRSRRVGYAKIFFALALILACGGLMVGVGTVVRRSHRKPPPL